MAIEKYKGNRYRVRVRLTIAKGVYVRKSKVVDSYKEAKKLEQCWLGEKAEKKDVSFAELIESFLEEKKQTVKKNTLYMYKKSINLHIYPYFKEYMISQISQVHISV